MGNNATNIMGNAYQIGSQNAQAAQQFAPTMYGMGNAGNQAIGSVGQAQAGWDQAALTDQYNQWMYGQTRPWELASMYQGLVSGNAGGQTTSK